MAKFDLTSVLSGAAALDTGAEISGRDILKYIHIDDIHADERNFYSLTGIDELAANIAMLGLQQPLRVRPAEDGDGYTIVSGHRRSAALRELKESREFDGLVPCIVESDSASPELQELRLIYANADTRVMTSYDISRQAARVEELLYKLKEQGVEFPGRMRDHVAEACKVSRTKLARLKAIDNNLTDSLHRLYADSKINESVAYELSQLEESRQEPVFNAANGAARKPEWITAQTIQNLSAAWDDIDKIECTEAPGCRCNLIDEKLSRRLDYKFECPRTCCRNCPDLATCSKSCTLCSGYKAEVKAAKKEAEEQRKADAKKAQQPDLELLNGIYQRLGEAMEKEGVSALEVAAALSTYRKAPAVLDKEAKELTKRLANGITSVSEGSPFGYLISLESIKALRRLQKLLQYDIGYLLGDDDEL